MRVYLDNCCFNRPFDDQSHPRVQLETEAKLHVQTLIQARSVDLVWSYMIDFENAANPFIERREAIAYWRTLAVLDVIETPALLARANHFKAQGLRPKDALHLAAAVEGAAAYFLTTDDQLLRKAAHLATIKVVTPPQFLTQVPP
jgi:predicted nucleic acid-binding protein